ncbi:Z1 domain-containing protein [Halobacillus karajensis]|uniref:Z1 domain protein n=1 Tax=Halobacillus karajensis TaxID=195088 RepID=A0A024P504_9BACI|nr:Z1 domain-containing protein [Halobacillus karajensis]CDQ20566.1 Z1 domain protein [Halobacillus karajensis]CDQ23965.1 Z1 domain protein [Halobacillus karajensis]CDQ27443.1 Z1 domain protein [Halobacillus karajensis]
MTATFYNLKTDGSFFQYLNRKNQYKQPVRECMLRTIANLEDMRTTEHRPGMLLGKIQSGKTRAFIGIMGLAYDHGFDMVILLTKGTNALVKQTYARLQEEFKGAIEHDAMRVFDVMSMPENLRKYELSQKLALIVKKETRNLDRLREAVMEKYPQLQDKRVLFIDDEADFASVAYEHKRDNNIKQMRVIASKMNDLRKMLNRPAFLQVTATPYSLYLQPEQMKIHEGKVFEPIRPAFTELVPVHDRYIGGEVYFDKSEKDGHLASYLYHEVEEKELEVMKKMDGRRVKMDRLLTQKNISNIRKAIINFIVGASIRRFQQRLKGRREQKYSFIIHTERGKQAHSWQAELVQAFEALLIEGAREGSKELYHLVRESYDDLIRSVRTLKKTPVPEFEDIYADVRHSLDEEYMVSSIVNSEKDVNELLDHKGELKLRAPMNIFIGGQILDRGVTIHNLIGFFYGRNPKSFQQDTVLQHSRMYGARPIADLAVTRFYTTQKIYRVMKQIHEFDRELRHAFERGGHHQGVVFIQRDLNNSILPCNPNKILLSNLTMITPHKRMLPVGFQTGYKTHIQKTIRDIDQFVDRVRKNARISKEGACLIPVSDAKKILTLIHATLEMEEGHDFHLDEYEGVLDYLGAESGDEPYVWLLTKTNRKIRRFKQDGKYENSPDTPGKGAGELAIAKKIAQQHPALILLRQEGKKEDGWRDSPFWWPMIVAQAETAPTVFANKTI